jgi:hypothetical protein
MWNSSPFGGRAGRRPKLDSRFLQRPGIRPACPDYYSRRARRPDEACGIAYDVLAATQSLGSFLVIGQLLELQQRLQPHRSSTVVGDFLACLEETVRERLWLYQWLTKDGGVQHRQREDP